MVKIILLGSLVLGVPFAHAVRDVKSTVMPTKVDLTRNKREKLVKTVSVAKPDPIAEITISSPHIGHDHAAGDEHHDGDGHDHGKPAEVKPVAETAVVPTSPQIGYVPSRTSTTQVDPPAASSATPTKPQDKLAAAGGKTNADPTPPVKALDFWEPVCFIVDPKVPEAEVNARIRFIIKSYGECGVAVKPDVFPVQDIPMDPGEAQKQAVKACPLDQQYKVPHSSVQAMVRWDGFSDKMCGSEPEKNPDGTDKKDDTSAFYSKTSKRVSGCAQVDVRSSNGKTLTDKQRQDLETNLKTAAGGTSHFGGFKTGSGPAFSAVDPEGNDKTAAHELGHNHSMENRVAKRKGTGMGLQGIGAEEGEDGPGRAFTQGGDDSGCGLIRNGANDQRNLKDEDKYVSPPGIDKWYAELPEGVVSPYKLAEGKSFFPEKMAVVAQRAVDAVKGAASAAIKALTPEPPPARVGTAPAVAETVPRVTVAASNPSGSGHKPKPGGTAPAGGPLVSAGTPKMSGGDKYGYDEKGKKPTPSAAPTSVPVVSTPWKPVVPQVVKVRAKSRGLPDQVAAAMGVPASRAPASTGDSGQRGSLRPQR